MNPPPPSAQVKAIDNETPPKQEPAIRVIAMPSDSNPGGSIFGGWLMSQMDLAGATVAVKRAKGPVVTIAVDGMVFHQPVMVGDEVSIYVDIKKVGNTSITVNIEAWVGTRFRAMVALDADYAMHKVTEGMFTYVAIDPKDRSRRQVPK